MPRTPGDPFPLPRLDTFLGQARRRAIIAVLLNQGVAATGAMSAGALFLLLLGTRVIAWYWPLVLFAGGFAAGLYRAMGRIPSRYRTGQLADRRLGLGDVLSTAAYFADAPCPEGRRSRKWEELVCRQADELCGKIAANAAWPIRLSRSRYPAGALALAAIVMFGVRYGALHSLDLRPPLAPAFNDYFTAAWQLAGSRGLPERKAPAPGAPLPLMPDSADGSPALGDAPDPTSAATAEGAARRDQQQVGERSGLLDDLLDTWDDLVAWLSPEGGSDGSGSSANNGDRSQQASGEEGEMSAAAPGDTLGEGSNSPDGDLPRGDENAKRSAHGESPERGGESGSDRKGSGSERTDYGKSNGDLNIKEAARLEAMGKIAEQFLERQARLTGEITVEVPGSKEQTLATPYSQTAAAHRDTGGKIHRDAIPLIYQPYVERYFEQLQRKE